MSVVNFPNKNGRLVDIAGLISDPDLAAPRLGDVLRNHGVAA
jgi:hypothetical protein